VLEDAGLIAFVATEDVAVARSFYERTLSITEFVAR
jgi:hypothetical protein